MIAVKNITKIQRSSKMFSGKRKVRRSKRALPMSVIRKVDKFVAETFSIDPSKLYTETRKPEVVRARFLAFVILKKIFGLRNADIRRVYRKSWHVVSYGIKNSEVWVVRDHLMEDFLEAYPHIHITHSN